MSIKNIVVTAIVFLSLYTVEAQNYGTAQKALQHRQALYDQGLKSVRQHVAGFSDFKQQLTSKWAIAYHEKYTKDCEPLLEKMSTWDFSIQANVDAVGKIYSNFYNNEGVQKDVKCTKMIKRLYYAYNAFDFSGVSKEKLTDKSHLSTVQLKDLFISIIFDLNQSFKSADTSSGLINAYNLITKYYDYSNCEGFGANSYGVVRVINNLDINDFN